MKPKFFFQTLRGMIARRKTSAEQDRINGIDQELKAMDDLRGQYLQEKQDALDKRRRALKRSKKDKVERELGEDLHRDISAI